MNDTNETAQKPAKVRSPYQVFLWGGLIMAALCFYLATERLAIKRPARADAYFITGILGILSAAMAWSLGAAHERARRTQLSLQDSLDRLKDSMQDMPRSLMEESVKVAAREAEGRRADQERQARELRAALEEGIRTGFAPLAPALSERIESSLSGLSESLRSDREERSASLRATAETVTSLQNAQTEWARASSSLLEKLREQGTALQADFTARDTNARTAWEQLAASARSAWELQATAAAESVQAALDIQMDKVRALTETLSGHWDETLRTQRESFAGEWREVLTKSQAHLEQATTQAQASIEQSATQARVQLDQSATQARTHIEQSATRAQTHLEQAGSSLSATSAQAEEWLHSLSAAAGTIGEALEGMRRGGEETAAQQAAGQAEWRATVEMFHEGMGGLLDRLQALGSYTQGQAALLERMEEVIRSFEERSADLIEETAMKAQESLLDALDQAGVRDAAAGEQA